MKTGNLNGVDLTSGGAGTNYLADDGTYKAVSGSQDLQSVTDVGSETTNTIRSTGAEIIVSGSGSKRFRVSSDDDDAYQTFSNEGQQIWSQGADRSKSSDFVLIDGDGLATGVEKIRVGTTKTTLSNNQLELNLTSSISNVENVIWDSGDWFNIYKNGYEQALGGGIRLELNRDITLGPTTYPIGLHFYEVSSGTGYPTSVGWVMGQYLSTSRAIQTYYDRYTGDMYQRYTIASNTWSTTTAGGWQQIATIESDGSLDLDGVLNLATTTNASPTTGDMWNDGIYITIQQNFKVRSDKPVFEMRSTKNGTWSVGERKGAINFYSDDASGGGAGVHAFIQAQAASTAGDATDLSFGVTNSGGAATEGLRLKSNGVLNYANAPTSSAGLVAGDIWNDSGTLKIV